MRAMFLLTARSRSSKPRDHEWFFGDGLDSKVEMPALPDAGSEFRIRRALRFDSKIIGPGVWVYTRLEIELCLEWKHDREVQLDCSLQRCLGLVD